MKICLHSISYSGLFYDGPPVPLEDQIEKIAKIGYEGIEVAAKRPLASPLDMDSAKVERLKEVAASYGIEIPIVAAYADLAKPDPVDREKELLYGRECIRLAYKLEVPYVRFYGGGERIYREVPFQKQWECVRDCLKWLAKVAADFGVVIALEPHTSVVQTHEDALDMVEQVGADNIAICLDPPLLAIHRERVKEAVKAVGRLMVHAHVMDFVRKPVLVEYHYLPGLTISELTPLQTVPLGEGEVPVREFVEACKEVGYKGHLSYEVCVPFHVKHRAPTIEDVDRLVEHAARYLRELLGK